MKDLKITMIQTELFWEDVESNLALFNEKIDSIREETHLIVLPEMFTTGFTMNPKNLAQDMEGASVKWLQEKARRFNADITGSMIINEKGRYYNRLLWAKPGGDLFKYDKRHLFRMAGEEKIYSAGDKNITVELHGWKIRPFICYDLRFPGWTRNIDNEYDIAVFIANWPEKRSFPWKLLLQARAVENICYVIGVNRVGADGNGYMHSGDSSVIDPRGKILFQKSSEEFIYTANLSYTELSEFRKAFPAWMDADTIGIS